MQFDEVVKKYLSSFEREYRRALIDGQHTPELSFRLSLHTLFEDLADLFVGKARSQWFSNQQSRIMPVGLTGEYMTLKRLAYLAT